MTSPFATIERAINAIKSGSMVILMDDENRENEGDLVMAAELVSADSINFMAKFGRGLICLPMADSYIDRLNLPMMASNNRSPYGTAFTISIEAKHGVSTGISAADRAHTIKTAVDSSSTCHDIISPGHVFPLRANPAGVLQRKGQTEGSVDLAKLAGLKPAAVICEIINEDGTMSRLDDLITFAKTHNILLVTIQDIIEYRIRHEQLIEPAATSTIPMHVHGNFQMTVFTNQLDNYEHFTLIKPFQKNPLVRIHSECITGDVFGSCKCDCGSQLQQSLAMIAKEGGILIYLRQEGRGIGLANKLRAYSLQEQGFDTVDANLQLGLPADSRDYAIAYQILSYWKIGRLRLITNNPKKIDALKNYGLEITERVPIITEPSSSNTHYLKTKQSKLGHLLIHK